MLDQRELKIRKLRLLKFLKDCDFELRCHPRKTNVLVGALSRKFLHISHLMVHEMDLIEDFRNLNLKLTTFQDGVILSQLEVSCDL